MEFLFCIVLSARGFNASVNERGPKEEDFVLCLEVEREVWKDEGVTSPLYPAALSTHTLKHRDALIPLGNGVRTWKFYHFKCPNSTLLKC